MIEKKSQQNDFNDLRFNDVLIPIESLDFPSIEVGDDIEISSDEQPDELVFILDNVPGAPDAKEIVIEQDVDNLEVEVQNDDVDDWKWEPKTFLVWLNKKFNEVPKHSGYDTTGLEKAISYFEALDKEITKAMRSDYKNEIDSAQAETAREQIEKGLERLIDRLAKVKSDKYKRHAKKTKAWYEETGIVKEAQKTTNIVGIVITVPLLISRIARVCINGFVSAGHDLEDMFERQVEEYKLDKREQAELAQLLADMGYTVLQDRGHPIGKHVNITRNDNFDWAAQYKG